MLQTKEQGKNRQDQINEDKIGNLPKKEFRVDFPGGAVVKNPPANAGDTGSSPGPGRSHMPQSSWACVPQLLSPCAATAEAHVPRARALNQEKLPQ